MEKLLAVPQILFPLKTSQGKVWGRARCARQAAFVRDGGGTGMGLPGDLASSWRV